MSGHSKWATIKHQKGINDKKRGAIFTKISRDITMAASEGGGDADMNFALRLAVEKAKEANMPKDNIERAIKKGTGDIASENIQRVTYEGYGPEGSAILVDCTTDNTNRTVAEIKRIFESAGGKFAQIGSVSWQFEEKGLIFVLPKKIVEGDKFGQKEKAIDLNIDDLALELMDVDGVEDVREINAEQDQEGGIELICQKNDLQKVYQAVKGKSLQIRSSELIKLAKDELQVSDEGREKILKFFDVLDDHPDVTSVWTNAKV